MDYVTVRDAIALPGLRIALTQGLPGPWGIAARTFFEIKGVDYIAVAQEVGGANEELKAWTGQTSAPVAVFNEERPRANWSEILLLAERLGPVPQLIPENEDERTLMFGLCHEICAEDGFGWNIRVLMLDMMEKKAKAEFGLLRSKYLGDKSHDHARKRLNRVIGLLSRRLIVQTAGGSRYLVGNALSAADIYWTAFSHLVRLIPEDICMRPELYRGIDEFCCAQLDGPLPQILIDHRDRILRDHFKLPMQF